MTREYPEFGSQDNEDAVLAALLPQKSGKYIDVGAHHPTNCSNTWSFYCRGWRGILVEPLMDCWPALLRERVGDLLVPVAASNVTDWSNLRVQGSISSLEASWPTKSLRIDHVPTFTLADIIGKTLQTGPWELCSIDVEGHERQVLEGIDWGSFSPYVFCVEYLGYSSDDSGADLSGQWEDLILEKGYKLVGTTLYNKIYLRADYKGSDWFKGSVEAARHAAKAGNAPPAPAHDFEENFGDHAQGAN